MQTSDQNTNLTFPSLDQALRGILRIASEAILVTDAQTRILMFSPGAESIFGYRHDEVLGRPIDMLLPAHFHGAHRDHVRSFANGSTHNVVMAARTDVLGRRKTGEEFFAEASVAKLDTPQGLFFTAILRDDSDRRMAEQELSEALNAAISANAAKSNFLATMSHEVRTPLNGVLAMAQAMSSDELPPVQRDRLDVIRQSGETLLALLNDVLDLSKIEAGKLELELIDFDLEELLRGAHAAFSALAEAKGLSFGLAMTEMEGRFTGDPTRIRQVLYNLISNALKFTEAGEVRVNAAYGQGQLCVRVADTGAGIPASALPDLFAPFVQADSATARRHGGTGLGLAICRQLLDLMGGTISAQSAPGEGSVFTFEFPLARAKPAEWSSDVKPTAASYTARFGAIRLLAAEDNAINRLVLETVLRQAGIQAVMVENGLEAVDACLHGEFDVVLMDVRMPHLGGPEATQLIRANDAQLGRRATPIIGLTANAMSYQLEEYIAAGMDAVVTKPLDVGKLLACLEEVLSRRND